MCKYCKEQEFNKENYIGVFEGEYRKMYIEIDKKSICLAIVECKNGTPIKRKDYMLDINYCPMCGKKLGD